jgi:hypothetical protein
MCALGIWNFFPLFLCPWMTITVPWVLIEGLYVNFSEYTTLYMCKSQMTRINCVSLGHINNLISYWQQAWFLFPSSMPLSLLPLLPPTLSWPLSMSLSPLCAPFFLLLFSLFWSALCHFLAQWFDSFFRFECPLKETLKLLSSGFISRVL